MRRSASIGAMRWWEPSKAQKSAAWRSLSAGQTHNRKRKCKFRSIEPLLHLGLAAMVFECESRIKVSPARQANSSQEGSTRSTIVSTSMPRQSRHVPDPRVDRSVVRMPGAPRVLQPTWANAPTSTLPRILNPTLCRTVALISYAYSGQPMWGPERVSGESTCTRTRILPAFQACGVAHVNPRVPLPMSITRRKSRLPYVVAIVAAAAPDRRKTKT